MKYLAFNPHLILGPVYKTIDEIEVHPVGVYIVGQDVFMEQCEEDDQNLKFWSVYIHHKSGGLECIADCNTKEEVYALRDWLINFAKHFEQ